MRRSGFTLVEVLVSLAIFALAAVALSAAYTNVLLARQSMRELDTTDDALFRSRAALLETAGLEDAKQGGEIDLADGRKAKWSAAIEPTTVSDLFAVTLALEATETSESKAVAFYLLRPAWSVSGNRNKLTDAARERLRRQRGFEGTSLVDQQGGSGGSGKRGGGQRDNDKGNSRGGKSGDKGDTSGEQSKPPRNGPTGNGAPKNL